MSPAERAFLEFAKSANPDDSAEFDAFCAEHPDLETDLRALYDPWRTVARLLREPPSDESVSERVEQQYDTAIQPVDLIDTGAGDAPPPDGEGEEEIHALHKSRYRGRGKIGKGGMGVVLRVWEPNLRRELAMKRLGEDAGGRTDSSLPMSRAVHRFIEEAQITGQLVHPGIVPVHELGIDSKGRVYFTMQHVRGSGFDEVIESARSEADGWTRARALRTLIRVCEAMAYAHARGVIHRDLKPANIMVGRFGETYVLDWGLARVLGRDQGRGQRDEEPSRSGIIDTSRSRLKELTPNSPLMTKDGQSVGTPCYMSPEQARGRQSEVGPPSDIFAIGAMLYHLLTGRAPYWRPNVRLGPHELVELVIAGPPSPLPRFGLPRELVLICNKAMAREAGDRYASMMELAADLEAYLDRRPISLLRHDPVYVARLALQRNRKLAMTVTVAALLVIALTVADLVRVRDAQRTTSRLLDFASAEVLIEREHELYPATPGVAPAMRAWLTEVDERLLHLAEYERELAGLGAGDQTTDAIRVRRAVDHMRTLAALRSRVAQRLTEAKSLAARSTELPGSGWQDAIEAIATSDKYGGLRISPQLGLVPLGANEQGFHEFWHVSSGTRPARDEQSEKLLLTPESGIVFVLLPGGSVTMGMPEGDLARLTAPEREVAIEPFFLGEFEVTQGQWLRVMHSEPSLFRPPHVIRRLGNATQEIEITLLHPVETVSWYDCTRFAECIDARLPTEAEWEYACRAGTRTAYYWGDDPALLFAHENVLDVSYDPNGRERRKDGWPLHAPVGSLSANGFGLYDMHGNVHEWCSDPYQDPVDPEEPARRRVFRGGSWYAPTRVALSGYRHRAVPQNVNHTLGMRAARDLQR